MTTSFENAAQVLLPPEPNLPYLRSDRAGALTLDPGALTTDHGLIAALEATKSADLHVDATGCALLPGLVDCHTHLPFAGWRAAEYAQKVTGVPYEEIARAGGGIASSARALRETPDEAVLQQATELAAEMLAHGTTTFECKSGYGLSREGELRALRLAAELGRRVRQQTTRTALLAHSVPAGYTAETWMDEVEAMVPAAVDTGATALDIFVESIAFGLDDLDRTGELAEQAGVALRAHVEQFSTMRSIRVALTHNARSLDHLSAIHPDDIGPLARSNTAAVLLPGAEFMGAEATAPARDLVASGAIVVLATDANPGTSPVFSLPLIVGLAVRRYGMSTREALLAVTLNAAYVLNLSKHVGSIELGKRADLVLLDAPSEHMAYRLGHNPVAATFIAGEPAYVRPDAEWRITKTGGKTGDP